MERRLLWSCIASMAVGFGGGYGVDGGWLRFVLHHLGGLGAVGLLAYAAAFIAYGRGRDFRRAWAIAFIISALLGLIGAYLVPPGEYGSRPAACGGSVSLAVGLIFIVVWALSKRSPLEAPPPE